MIDETRRLFHRLAATADEAHDDLGVTAAQRAVLEALARGGPQTVPGIARTKRVSRQHIQLLVNALLEAGLVEARANPAHQRSVTLELSAAGRRVFGTIAARELVLLREMARRLRKHDLGSAAVTLRAASELLEASS